MKQYSYEMFFIFFKYYVKIKKVRNFSSKGLAKYICLVYDKSVDTKQKYIVSGK